MLSTTPRSDPGTLISRRIFRLTTPHVSHRVCLNARAGRAPEDEYSAEILAGQPAALTVAAKRRQHNPTQGTHGSKVDRSTAVDRLVSGDIVRPRHKRRLHPPTPFWKASAATAGQGDIDAETGGLEASDGNGRPTAVFGFWVPRLMRGRRGAAITTARGVKCARANDSIRPARTRAARGNESWACARKI